MDVSIIIINYNTFGLTSSCINSIIEHTQGCTYEIILVDNASVECSADLFLQKFPKVKLIKSPKNLGFTGGNNLGIEIATGDYLLLLNSDVVLTEDSISSCLKILKNNDTIGIISCMLKYPNGSIQRQCQRFPSIMLTTIELLRIHKLIPQPTRGKLMGNGFSDHLESTYSDSVWGTFFMFPNKILEKLEHKKLPGDYFMYAEDMLWCYIIKKMGYTVYYNANTSVIHYSGASASTSVLKFKHQNEYSFILKYYGLFYARVLVLLRYILYATNGNKDYAKEISRIYWELFINGRII